MARTEIRGTQIRDGSIQLVDIDVANCVGTTEGTFAAGDHVHIADDITFTPAGTISSTDTQSAIEELDTEKLAASGGTLTNYKETLYSTTTSGNITIDLTDGNVQRIILGGTHQITMPSDPGVFAQSFVLIIECATYTPTWNTSPVIEWLTSDGAAPTLVTTADLVNVLTFIWDDVDSRWLGFLSGKETA